MAHFRMSSLLRTHRARHAHRTGGTRWARHAMKRAAALVPLLCGITLSVTSRAEPKLAAASVAHDDRDVGEHGRFSLLTYNVAGLPEPVSESHPAAYTAVISPLLNLYDVAVVQEDFAYHGDLASRAWHAYRTPALVPDDKVGIGDGLNEFSRLPFSGFERVTWRACHGTLSDGSDCFAPKGFTVATHTLSSGAELDLYDVHFDAGYSPGDVAAREVQAGQLLAYLQKRSLGHAVVVAGDTNMDGEADEKTLVSFMKRAGLVDACRELRCADPTRIDRVMYRGSAGLDLRAESLGVDSRFVSRAGKDLSDHKALGVVLEWHRVPRTKASR